MSIRRMGIPKYAHVADPTRLVKALCKGSCGRVRWHQLDKPHPGWDELRKAEMKEYTATCLMCGRRALDNYDWYAG